MIRRIVPQPVQPINPPRRRSRSGFKKVDLKRAVDAAQRLGLRVGNVEIRPDGTISLTTVEATRAFQTGDVFAEWSNRL